MATLPAHLPGLLLSSGAKLSGPLRGGGVLEDFTLYLRVRTIESGDVLRLAPGPSGPATTLTVAGSAYAATRGGTVQKAGTAGLIQHVVLVRASSGAARLYVDGSFSEGSLGTIDARWLDVQCQSRLYRLCLWSRALSPTEVSLLPAYGIEDADRWEGAFLDLDFGTGVGRHAPDRSSSLSGLDADGGQVHHILPVSYGTMAVTKVFDAIASPAFLLDLPPHCGITGVEFESGGGIGTAQVGTDANHTLFVSTAPGAGLVFAESQEFASQSPDAFTPVRVWGLSGAVKIRTVYEVRGLPSAAVAPPPEVEVTLTADPEILVPGGWSFLEATVQNGTSGVTWTIEDGPGTLQDEEDFTATYVAPGTPASAAVTVRATSVDDPSKFDEAEIAIVYVEVPTITAVTLVADPESIARDGGISILTASVSGTGAYNDGVTFSVISGPGTLGFAGSHVRYLDGTAAGTVVVRATSVVDPSKWDQVEVEVTIPLFTFINEFDSVGWRDYAPTPADVYGNAEATPSHGIESPTGPSSSEFKIFSPLWADPDYDPGDPDPEELITVTFTPDPLPPGVSVVFYGETWETDVDSRWCHGFLIVDGPVDTEIEVTIRATSISTSQFEETTITVEASYQVDSVVLEETTAVVDPGDDDFVLIPLVVEMTGTGFGDTTEDPVDAFQFIDTDTDDVLTASQFPGLMTFNSATSLTWEGEWRVSRPWVETDLGLMYRFIANPRPAGTVGDYLVRDSDPIVITLPHHPVEVISIEVEADFVDSPGEGLVTVLVIYRGVGSVTGMVDLDLAFSTFGSTGVDFDARGYPDDGSFTGPVELSLSSIDVDGYREHRFQFAWSVPDYEPSGGWGSGESANLQFNLLDGASVVDTGIIEFWPFEVMPVYTGMQLESAPGVGLPSGFYGKGPITVGTPFLISLSSTGAPMDVATHPTVNNVLGKLTGIAVADGTITDYGGGNFLTSYEVTYSAGGGWPGSPARDFIDCTWDTDTLRAWIST